MTTREAKLMLRGRLSLLYDNKETAAITRLVMEHVTGWDAVDLLLRDEHELPEFMPARLEAIVSRLERYEPVQYVLGTAHFHGLDLEVTPATLIPRPETELLVDIIVDDNSERSDLTVLDIGTGSGCIAIALARALRWATVDAVDISEAALEVARRNATRCKARVNFTRHDALDMPRDREKYDIIVSNPPYVLQSEAATMERNVLDYEPHEALFVPDDEPLKFYIAITRYAAEALRPRGCLYLEINRAMSDRIKILLDEQHFNDVNIVIDSFGNKRYAIASR